MGLFSRLFGGGANRAENERQSAVARAREVAATTPTAEAILAALPQPVDHALVLEVVNDLFEQKQTEAAENLARHLAGEAAAPSALRKAVLRHFVTERRIGEVAEAMAAYLRERPSETDFAVKLGRHHLAQKNWDAVIEHLAQPLASAPESRHLYGILGEAHYRLGDRENALNHLRTGCELFEEAFRLRQVLPDDMVLEQFEFTRLYGLLEDTAKEHLGEDGMAAAFENLTMAPSSVGLVREAEDLAVTRIEYKPPHTTLPSLDVLKDEAAKLGDALTEAPRARFLAGKIALREGRPEDAMRSFRETLELDLEAYAAYFGWAACEVLSRLDPLPEVQPLASEDQQALEKLCPDWPNMTPLERTVATRSLAPLGKIVKALADAGMTSSVHPLDVRLRDLYQERVALRFEDDGRPPQALPAFASKGRAHTRLDEFLALRPERATFARQAGYLLADVMTGSMLEQARAAAKAAQEALPDAARRKASAVEDFLALACETRVRLAVFGEDARDAVAEALDKSGALGLLERLATRGLSGQ